MSHYGEAALASECQLLRTAANGSRNSQLNKAAYAMARLVASGEINASQAKRALHEAAKETGLDEKEIHATIASGWKAGCGKPRYIYRDANGTPLYAKKRVGNSRQKYIVEHQNGGVWSCGRGGADPVPYRLPELLASDGPVYMTEGEKHADRLAEWGLVATSLKDWKPEFARYIQGRPVIILPDNDEEGQNQAAKARDLALAAGCTVRVVKLPGLPHKGDIMDWDGTAEELAALVDKTAPIIRPPMVVEQSVGAGPTKMLRPLDLARLANIDPTPKQFAIEGLAPLGEVTLFTGPGSAGKSLFGQQMATAAAAGLGSCLGLGVANAPAVFLTCEDDSEELHWRQKHICKTLGTSFPSLDGKLFLISLRGQLDNVLTVESEGRERVPGATYVAIAELVKQTGSKLVFLDNVAHLFDGNENDRGEVTQFINLLNRLAGETGAAIILLAHPPKSSNPAAASHDFSGSTAWLNAVRSQFKIDWVRDGEQTISDYDARVLTLGKANYAKKGGTINIRWHDYSFINEDDLPEDKRKELNETIRANKENAAFLGCLRERNRQRRQVSEKPNASNYAPKEFATMPEAKGLSKDRLKQAMDRLFRIGAIERGFVYRDTSEGKDIIGIREVEAKIPEGYPEGYRKVLPEGSGNPQKTTGNSVPIYTTYINGGGLDGPTALREVKTRWSDDPKLEDQTDDGLDENGDVIGWNDGCPSW